MAFTAEQDFDRLSEIREGVLDGQRRGAATDTVPRDPRDAGGRVDLDVGAARSGLH